MKKFKCSLCTILSAALIAGLPVPGQAMGGKPTPTPTPGRSGVTTGEEPRGRMGETEPMLSDAAQQSIHKAINEVLLAAFKNNDEGIVDYLAAADRTRIDQQRRETQGQADRRTADTLSDQWQQTFDSSFDDTLETAPLGMSMSAATATGARSADKATAARVTVGGGSSGSSHTLSMVDEGTLMSSWRIDVPDSLTWSELQRALQEARASVAADIQSQTNGTQVAQNFSTKVLRVLSSGNASAAVGRTSGMGSGAAGTSGTVGSMVTTTTR